MSPPNTPAARPRTAAILGAGAFLAVGAAVSCAAPPASSPAPPPASPAARATTGVPAPSTSAVATKVTSPATPASASAAPAPKRPAAASACPGGGDELAVDLDAWLAQAPRLKTAQAWGAHIGLIEQNLTVPAGLPCPSDVPTMTTGRHEKVVLRDGAPPFDVLQLGLTLCAGESDAFEQQKTVVFSALGPNRYCLVAALDEDIPGDSCKRPSRVVRFIDAVSDKHKTLEVFTETQLAGCSGGNTGDRLGTTTLLELDDGAFRPVFEEPTGWDTPRRTALSGKLTFEGPPPRRARLTITGSECADNDTAQDPSTGWWACDMKPVRRIRMYSYRGDHYEAKK